MSSIDQTMVGRTQGHLVCVGIKQCGNTMGASSVEQTMVGRTWGVLGVLDQTDKRKPREH